MKTEGECLTYSDWTDPRKPVKSKLVPELKVDDGEDFRCPRCAFSTPHGLTHGKSHECVCGLQMVVYGNLLTLIGESK